MPLKNDVLETIVHGAPAAAKHAPLLSAIATKTDMHGITVATSRDHFVPEPHRILDREGNVVGPHFKEWMQERLEQHGSDPIAVWHAYKDAGYLMTERVPIMLYLVHDRGGEQTNFTQLKIYEEHEFVARELFGRDSWSKPYSAESMLNGQEAGNPVDRREIGAGWYRLWDMVDMAEFSAIAEDLFVTERERQGGLSMELSNPRSGEVTRTTFAALYPEFDKYPWKGRRFFQDWEQSSAGRSGARVCRHWVFDTRDYQKDPMSKREMSFIPQWSFNRSLAKVDKPGNTAYELFGKLKKLDHRIGVPFSWYFYMLHGNRVEDWAGRRVIQAAEEGLIVMPEWDYRVLKRWDDQPYGF